MTLIAATITTHIALLAAMAWGAYQNHLWMQRQFHTTVSPDTMLDRVLRLIDTSALKPAEIDLVRSLKERRKYSQVVNVTTGEFELIKQIHGRLYR
ncbi:hypothetical protein [Cupriavidus sp. RAF12]|uniref:hypothetical protein n=1 Tax=Cupriavidus sp. RAF12 TaxID=3233050 RepID=UPI003F91F0AB